MKTSIETKINSEIISASIIDRNFSAPYETMRNLAIEYFGENENIKINKVAAASQPESDGYLHHYDIYESYVDSGSVDYAYFAINTGCEEIN